MVCFHPVTQYKSFTEDGKIKWVFDKGKAAMGLLAQPVVRPCGQCIGCRLDKSRDTATRCLCESQMYSRNCFITLTVDDEHMNEVFPGFGLCHRPWQLFLKQLRKRFAGYDRVEKPDWWPDNQVWNYYPIRALMCGEYGSLLKRPHYHACLFNFDFEDKTLWTIRNGVKLYRSAELEKLWPYGYSTIGEVNFQSAAYLSRYVTKKITGDMADEHYFNPETGEIMKSEYVQYPRGFGLGRLWLDKYETDVYPSDLIVMNSGKLKIRPPRYYDKIYDLTNPDKFADIKAERIKRASAHSNDTTFERLLVREQCQMARFQKLHRGYENE